MRIEKLLVESVLVSATATKYYATTVKNVAVITQATVCNPTGGSVNLTVYLTPPGAAPAAANEIYAALPVPAGKTTILSAMINHVLISGGEAIQAVASTTGVLVFRVSGYEVPA